MQRFLLAKRAWAALLGLACVAFFYGLGAVPLIGPDEPRYAQVAREMYERGDWVTPTLAGHTWFEKPALLYWLIAAGYRLFGVGEFAARAGAALAGLSTVLLVGVVAKRAEFESGEAMRGFGVSCAGVAASALGLLVFSRAASFDVLLTATLTASLSCFFLSEVERNEGRRRSLLAGFYAFAGASLLAKGLAGVVLPAGVVATYFLIRRRWPGLSRVGVWWGVPLCLVVAAVWYGPVYARHGREFVDEFFVQHHFARYLSNRYHHPQPFYFYAPIMLMLSLPWVFFFVGGLAGLRETNTRAEDAATKLRVLALAWLVAPVLFFSASGSKLPGYVLPALPGALILAGDSLHRYLRDRRGLSTMRLTGLLALLFSAAAASLAFPVAARRIGLGGAVPVACAVALALPPGLAAAAALLFPRSRSTCAAAVVVATLVTIPLVAACALGDAARKETTAQLFQAAEREGLKDLRVVHLHGVERTAEFYGAGRLAYDAGGEPVKFEGTWQVKEFVGRSGGRALVLVPLSEEHQLAAEPGLRSRRVAENGSFALNYVELGAAE